MFRLWLYQEVVRRCMETFSTLKIKGLEILSQIFVERKLGAARLRLTLTDSFAIKNASRPAHSLKTLCEGAYSAVAQWQSIRLLTEGL